MRMRGLPVERFPRWECAPFTEKDRAELKEGIAKAGAALTDVNVSCKNRISSNGAKDAKESL